MMAGKYLLDIGGPEHDANYSEQKVEILQSLTGTEFLFFTAVHKVMCLGFVTKTASTADCVDCCQTVLSQGQGFLCSSVCHLALPWVRSWQGTQLGQ